MDSTVDDSLPIIPLCSIVSAVSAYIYVRDSTNREVDHFHNGVRLQSPFGSPTKWARVDQLVTRFRYRMNLVQLIATLVGAIFGAGVGALLTYVDKIISSHG